MSEMQSGQFVAQLDSSSSPKPQRKLFQSATPAIEQQPEIESRRALHKSVHVSSQWVCFNTPEPAPPQPEGPPRQPKSSSRQQQSKAEGAIGLQLCQYNMAGLSSKSQPTCQHIKHTLTPTQMYINDTTHNSRGNTCSLQNCNNHLH